MTTADVPADIFSEIRSAAMDAWPDDKEMRDWTIEQELESYRSIRDLDFGAATAVRDAILAGTEGYSDTWEDRSNFVEEEVAAYNALLALEPNDVPSDLVAELKVKAQREHDWYSLQLEEVTKGIEHHRYVECTRARIEPIRPLLVEMERIIGSECYNGNIQNYSAWGVWEGEGRSFRYPTSFVRGDKIEKRHERTDDLEAEELITGHYRFGANELSIYRALAKIVDLLKSDYGFDAHALCDSSRRTV